MLAKSMRNVLLFTNLALKHATGEHTKIKQDVFSKTRTVIF